MNVLLFCLYEFYTKWELEEIKTDFSDLADNGSLQRQPPTNFKNSLIHK